jgi:pimeloyl-ACP methyl ester carboxylesterase
MMSTVTGMSQSWVYLGRIVSFGSACHLLAISIGPRRPTLFYGGELDWNVPIQGSEQLYQVMRRVGVETRLVVYPDEHHGEWRFANERDAMLRTLGWFDKFLKSTAETE